MRAFVSSALLLLTAYGLPFRLKRSQLLGCGLGAAFTLLQIQRMRQTLGYASRTI